MIPWAVFFASIAVGAFGIVFAYMGRNAFEAGRHPEQHEHVPGEWQ